MVRNRIAALTPKAFANFSPGFEEREPWVDHINGIQTLKGFANRRTLTGFSAFWIAVPGLSLSLQPWAEISERLRRISK